MIETLGHYRILEAIGRGRIGDLYRARDTRLGRTVAIRVLAPAIAGDPEQRERFLADARASAKVSHPNIAALYEVAEDAGVPYLACEFVTGQTLKSLVGGRPLNPRRAIDFAIQMTDALADGYASGLVHGGLHPDGVIITPKGNAKILDFGLVAWTSGGMAGPDTPVDHQTDILSLGLILFEMLIGKAPSTVRTLSAINPDLPRELDPIVLKASARNKSNRYESAAALSAELRAVAAILDARSEASQPLAIVPAKRTPWRWSIGWLIAILAIGAIGWLVWLAERAT